MGRAEQKNRETRTGIVGAAILSSSAAGLAEIIYKHSKLHYRLEPSAQEIETARISAQLAHAPLGWEGVYARAREHAQGQHALEMVVMAAGALACLYGAYRSFRKIYQSFFHNT